MSAPGADRRLTAISNHLAAPRLVVVLPDGSKVFNATVKHGSEEVSQLLLEDKAIAEYTHCGDKAFSFELTSVGTPFEGATTHLPKYDLVILRPPTQAPHSARISVEDMWIAIYALFTMRYTQEYIPINIFAFENAREIVDYLVNSGLGRTSLADNKAPTTSTTVVDRVFYLSRAGFWQGAGTVGYHSRQYWLQDTRPPFPNVPSFTRSEKVIAKHPLRPSKPRPGQVLYRRWCSRVGQMLELRHFDLDGINDPPGTKVNGVSRDLAAFNKWHNDPRVSDSWKEHGTLEDHRKYIEAQYKDPHSIPAMFSWDGDLMGYVEVTYIKEDHVAQHFPAETLAGDWDRGIHVLAGEEKYLGGGRCKFFVRIISGFGD